jgi:hypothetical protein
MGLAQFVAKLLAAERRPRLTNSPSPIPAMGCRHGILIPVRQLAGGRELYINTRTRTAIQRSVR